MGLIHLFIGLFFIILGFLVRSFPGIIAGYNTMPAEKKKNIDMDGLSRFLRNGFIIMGLAVVKNGLYPPTQNGDIRSLFLC